MPDRPRRSTGQLQRSVTLKEPLRYNKDWVLVLDIWVDGSTPDSVLAELSKGMGGMDHEGMGTGHGGHGMSKPKPSGPSRMMMSTTSELLGGDAGDVAYLYYLVNGRTAKDPQTFRAKRGDRIRIRFLHADGDTTFRVALGGHTMTSPTPTSAPSNRRRRTPCCRA
ncbi:hypothetical protein [Streptomyces chattanoogensis]|uniref:hypothetical protein n=1 Tax=Streptomyces chattanoogensis TaxID=66876 RepID=UPI0006B4153B